jgi:hypothetical protein
MREKSAICRIIMTKLIAVSAITTLLGIEETLADLRSICAGRFHHLTELSAVGAGKLNTHLSSCWSSNWSNPCGISSPFGGLLM